MNDPALCRPTVGFEQVGQRHWFGTTELPGEPTGHPALRIVPDVHVTPAPLSSGARHQVRYTGGWALVHVPTGHELSAGHWLPLEWLRRFARLLATCGIAWDQVDGNPTLIDHPQNIIVRAIGAHVLDCWRRGVPVGPGVGVTLRTDADGDTRMYCGNRHCEDEFTADGEPAQLLGMGEDGQDEARSRDFDELFEIARDMGWRDLGQGLWLCDTCATTHQPAPPHIAQRLSK